MKSKDFYWLITKKFVTKATGSRKWEHEIQSMNLSWPCYFSKLKLICKEPKLREFYYKLLLGIIVTKKDCITLVLKITKKAYTVMKVTRWVRLSSTATFPSPLSVTLWNGSTGNMPPPFHPPPKSFYLVNLVMISYRLQICRLKSLIIACYLQNITYTVKN